MKNYHQQGFSFIEISVVLSVIGLVLASIMAGNYLLTAAKLNSIVTDVARVKAVVEGFYGKYDALPGDIPNATSFWATSCTNSGGSPVNPCNGDGDRRIEYNTSGGSEKFEDVRAWQHLSLSGYYPGDFSGVVSGNRFALGVNAPESEKAGLGYWIMRPMGTTTYYGQTGNLVMVGRVDGTTGTLDAAGLTVQESHSLDLKTDDGEPDTGDVFVGRGRGLGDERCMNGVAPTGDFTQNSASFEFADLEVSCIMAFWIDKDATN